MRATEQKTHGVSLTHRLDKKQMQEANFYRKDKFLHNLSVVITEARSALCLQY